MAGVLLHRVQERDGSLRIFLVVEVFLSDVVIRFRRFPFPEGISQSSDRSQHSHQSKRQYQFLHDQTSNGYGAFRSVAAVRRLRKMELHCSISLSATL